MIIKYVLLSPTETHYHEIKMFNKTAEGIEFIKVDNKNTYVTRYPYDKLIRFALYGNGILLENWIDGETD